MQADDHWHEMKKDFVDERGTQWYKCWICGKTASEEHPTQIVDRNVINKRV